MFPIIPFMVLSKPVDASLVAQHATGSHHRFVPPALSFQVALAPGDTVTHQAGGVDSNNTTTYSLSYMAAGDYLTSTAGTRPFPSIIGLNDGHAIEVLNDGVNNTVVTAYAGSDGYDTQPYTGITGTVSAMNVSPNASNVHVLVRTNKVTTAANGSFFIVSDINGQVNVSVQQGSVTVQQPNTWSYTGMTTGYTASSNDNGTHHSETPPNDSLMAMKVRAEAMGFLQKHPGVSAKRLRAFLRHIDRELGRRR